MNIYSNAFKALGDLNRLQIIELLGKGEICACKILEEFNFTQPTLSHHMKILVDSELVNVRKEGKWSHYSLNTTYMNNLNNYLISITQNQ